MKRFLLATVLTVAASSAYAQTTTYRVKVEAADNIYGAGATTAPGGGNVPAGVITLPAGSQCVVIKKVAGSFVAPDCTSPEGCITVNDGRNYNDADGAYAQVKKSSNTGTASISGIAAPGAGYLVALFTDGTPSGAAPPLLDFETAPKTKFLTLSPLIDQTFFVGDGRKLDGSGPHQTFVVPAGATALTFGISDTCDNFNGAPGCYFDNKGNFKLKVDVSTTACATPQ